MFFNLGIRCQIKIYPVFFFVFVFFFVLIVLFSSFYRNSFELKKVSINFKTYWNILMKILYLKGYLWLLSQNQRVRNVFLGYRWYRAQAKHVNPFLQNIKVKGRRSSHRRCSERKIVLRNFAEFTGKHLCQSLFLNKMLLRTSVPGL